MTRVWGEDVEYMGWKLYGIAVQLVPCGSNFTWANPLALLAVMDPLCLVVRSLMTTRNPFEVSRKPTFRLSPEFMNRSLALFGVNVARVDWTGLAGAWETPFLVMKAKLTYSMPVLAAHVGFCKVPATGSSDRLSMFSAAHHLVGSQPLAPTATAQVGHGTQPGG